MFLNSLWAFVLILGAVSVFLWLALAMPNTGKLVSSYVGPKQCQTVTMATTHNKSKVHCHTVVLHLYSFA